MPPRTRKATASSRPASPPKRSKAKRPAAETADRPPREDVVEDEPVAGAPDVEETDVEQTDAEPDGTEPRSRLISRNVTEDASSGSRVEADGSTVTHSRSTHSTHTRREFEPGHTVDESVTVTRERTERVPVPYAGPVSEHPAPVG